MRWVLIAMSLLDTDNAYEHDSQLLDGTTWKGDRMFTAESYTVSGDQETINVDLREIATGAEYRATFQIHPYAKSWSQNARLTMPFFNGYQLTLDMSNMACDYNNRIWYFVVRDDRAENVTYRYVINCRALPDEFDNTIASFSASGKVPELPRALQERQQPDSQATVKYTDSEAGSEVDEGQESDSLEEKLHAAAVFLVEQDIENFGGVDEYEELGSLSADEQQKWLSEFEMKYGKVSELSPFATDEMGDYYAPNNIAKTPRLTVSNGNYIIRLRV